MGPSLVVPIHSMRKLLLLGGTAEAVQLANRVGALSAQIRCVTSLAGRTRNPRKVMGEVRVGGFGGTRGLTQYIAGEQIDLLVDATHPFAAQMALHASIAAKAAKIDHVKLLRPAWVACKGDHWLSVNSTQEAASVLQQSTLSDCNKVFLTTGYQGIEVFQSLSDHEFLVRLVDHREQVANSANFQLLTDRGPFDVDAEVALMKRHRIKCVVSKNSGGEATYAKIEAARRLALPVIMIRRPAPPPGLVVDTVAAVMHWLESHLGETS